jgi:hypothetical protein
MVEAWERRLREDYAGDGTLLGDDVAECVDHIDELRRDNALLRKLLDQTDDQLEAVNAALVRREKARWWREFWTALAGRTGERQ